MDAALSLDLNTGRIRYAFWSVSGMVNFGATTEDLRRFTFNSSTIVYGCNVRQSCCGSAACSYSSFRIVYGYFDDSGALALMNTRNTFYC